MQVDGIEFVQSSTVKGLILESLTAFPVSPVIGQQFVLTTTVGQYAPDQYTYLASGWSGAAQGGGAVTGLGEANGIATLDGTGKVPSAQIPALDFVPTSEVGTANGVATLDGSGKVPSAQLPSYVDDVLEYATTVALPVTGESGKIYVVLDMNKVYRWSGSAYTEIVGSPGSTDSVTEGTINKYFTVERAVAAAPVQTVAGRTGAVVISQTDVSNAAPLNMPQNIQSGSYTTVIGDSGKHIFHPSSDTTARTWTIPANGTVAYEIGTALTFVNNNGAGVLSIAINSDTLRLAGAGTTGTRTLTANGVATALKVSATEWLISGTNLT